MPDRSPQTLWETALGQLELQVTRPNFETWLRNTVGLGVEDSHFVVGVPSDFAVEWLRSRMNPLVNRTVSQLLDSPVSVSFQVLGAPPPSSPPSANGRQPPSASPSPPADLNPCLTFESFTAVESNRLAYRAARRIGSGDAAYSPLVLSGPVGVGKTHLLHAIGHQGLQAGKRVVALTAESFVDRYAKAVRAGQPHTFRYLFQDCGLLLLDDLGFLATRSASQDQFFHIFHTLQGAGCSVAVTVDAALHTVSGLSPRVRSRLQAGLVTALQLPPPHERLEILRAKAARLAAPLPDPVIRLIADQPYETISELEGALNRLVAYAELTHVPLSIDSALEALYPLGRPQQEPQPDAILQAVCRHFHISLEQLVGPSRARHITYARHIAMYLLRSYGDHGLAQIGQLLGGRDHSTVLHAYRRIHRELTSLPQTRNDIDQLKTLLLKHPAA